jgi:hypothetical protein
MKRQIRCSHCGTLLFETDKSDGVAGSEAMRLGFVFKMPFLYGISGCYFFCNKECHKEWCKKHITEDAKEKGNKSIATLKKQIPQMTDNLQKAASKLVEAFNKFKKQ